MKIEIRELEERKAKLVISDASPAVVNTLRRILVSEVPKMAIETVEFHMGTIRDEDGTEYESKTPLFDEIIAHRLSLVPVPTDLELFTFKEDCTCGGEGCPNCEIMYAINKIGPCTVYSGDLEPLGDEALSVKESLIPIVVLNDKQAILVYATAVLGQGKQHTKWQAAHAVGYQYYPDVEIDHKKCDMGGRCVESCPKGVLEKKDGKVVKTADFERCNLCTACEEVCELGAIKVPYDEEKFIFRFETDGSYSAREALVQALEIGVGVFDDFKASISEIKE